MDTTTQAALTKGHENLATDLANLSQLIEPQNQQAHAVLNRVQRRLEDIEQLVKFDTRPDASLKSERLRLSDTNPLLHSDPADTMMHVRSVLMTLCEIEFEDGAPGEPGDFNCGLHDLFYLLHNTLKMHATHGNKLPDDVVLHQADWQLELQRRAS